MGKRILMINRDQSNSGGQEIIFQYLVRGFSETESVTVITRESDDPFMYVNPDKTKTVTISGRKFLDDFLIDKKSRKAIMEQIRQHDIIFINNPISFLGFYVAIKSKGKQLFFSFHAKGYSKDFFKRQLNHLRRKLILHLTSKISGCIFLTPEDEKYFFSNLLPWKKMNSVVIPNGVDTKRFKPQGAGKHDQFTLLFIGKIQQSKGVELLIECAEKFEDGEILIQFAGGGNLELVERIKGTRNCKYLGIVPQTQMPEMLDRADAFTLPSYSEAFPLTILEAMSTAKPVISTDIAGIKSILSGPANIVISPGSVDELESAVRTMMEQRDKYAKLGEANREEVLEKYSTEVMVKSYLDFFETCA